MVKRSRRRRSVKPRRQRRRKSSRRRSRKSYSSAVPRPLKNSNQLGFPAIKTTSLRICFTKTLMPHATEGPVGQYKWNGSINFLANGMFGPDIEDISPTARCPMGMENYAKVYSAYRVNSSKITVRCEGDTLLPDWRPVEGVVPVPTGPAYVAVARRRDHTSLATMLPYTVSTLRENGWRFLKIDPVFSNHLGVPAPIRGAYARRSNGAALSAGYVSRYTKPIVDAAGETQSPHSTLVNSNPSLLQFYQIYLVQPEVDQVQAVCPTPVQVNVEIVYNVTFWFNKTIKDKDTEAEVVAARAEGLP